MRTTVRPTTNLIGTSTISDTQPIGYQSNSSMHKSEN